MRPAFIGTGSMSDPYNPFEKGLMLTRHALELIDAYGCGVAIATKSDLIARDVDILAAIQRLAALGRLAVVEGAAQAGARFIYLAFGVTMRQGQREYFLEGLERAFPGQG